MKIENVLKGSDGKWKICDFGSSTPNQYRLINNVNRDIIQEEIEKTTTPLYRSPE
jgi:AP2-associated kinase